MRKRLSTPRCIRCSMALNANNWYEGYAKVSRYICKTCVNAQRREERAETQRWLNEEKQKTGCEICGFNDHPAALCFHHIDPSKKKHPVTAAFNLKAVKKERKKCIVLCFNCHQILHNS